MTARIGDSLPVPSLQVTLQSSQNAPLVAQYTWAMIHALPAEVTRNVGSRQFRAAQRDFWEHSLIQFDATRRDIQTGLAYLDRFGAFEVFRGGRHG